MPVALIVLAIVGVAVLKAAERFPLGTPIFGTIFALSAVAVVLFLGELVVIGWIVDFLDWIASSGIRARYAPLEFDQVGEVLIVKLGNHMVSDEHCQAVQRQLDRFVGEHYCDFILDFSAVGRLSRSFRGVMTRLASGAERGGEAGQAVSSRPHAARRNIPHVRRRRACAGGNGPARRPWLGRAVLRPPGDPAASDIT